MSDWPAIWETNTGEYLVEQRDTLREWARARAAKYGAGDLLAELEPAGVGACCDCEHHSAQRWTIGTRAFCRPCATSRTRALSRLPDDDRYRLLDLWADARGDRAT